MINKNATIAVQTNFARDYMTIEIDKKLFQGNISVVTQHALQVVQKSIDSSIQPLAPCTRVFNQTTGMPCAHTFEIERREGALDISDFNSL